MAADLTINVPNATTHLTEIMDAANVGDNERVLAALDKGADMFAVKEPEKYHWSPQTAVSIAADKASASKTPEEKKKFTDVSATLTSYQRGKEFVEAAYLGENDTAVNIVRTGGFQTGRAYFTPHDDFFISSTTSPKRISGFTMAVSKDNVPLVTKLLEAGLKPDSVVWDLGMAKSVPMAKLLMEHGAQTHNPGQNYSGILDHLKTLKAQPGQEADLAAILAHYTPAPEKAAVKAPPAETKPHVKKVDKVAGKEAPDSHHNAKTDKIAAKDKTAAEGKAVVPLEKHNPLQPALQTLQHVGSHLNPFHRANDENQRLAEGDHGKTPAPGSHPENRPDFAHRLSASIGKLANTTGEDLKRIVHSVEGVKTLTPFQEKKVGSILAAIDANQVKHGDNSHVITAESLQADIKKHPDHDWKLNAAKITNHDSYQAPLTATQVPVADHKREALAHAAKSATPS